MVYQLEETEVEEIDQEETEAKEEGVEEQDPQQVLEVLGVAGHTFRGILMVHHPQCARSTTFSGSQLTGVRSRHHARGRTTLFQKTNETVTNLSFLTIY